MSVFALGLSPTAQVGWRIESSRRRIATTAPEAAIASATDAQLVTLHLAGDPRAFSELVRRYTRAIFNVTYRFTNDAGEAENLSQETFLRAWNALPRLALDKPLKPYFVKIAVNLCRDWAEQRKLVMPEASEAETASDFPDEASDPYRAVSEAELREQLRARLELLPPMYRTVITLRYTEEMSYEEMATALDLPLNTVRTYLHRAKLKLRELLEKDA